MRGSVLLVGRPSAPRCLGSGYKATPADTCEICGADTPELVYRQGETDSFGFECLVECSSCAAKCALEERTWRQALDVPEQLAPDGQEWRVEVGDQSDRTDGLSYRGSSLRVGVALLRAFERRAEPYGGLYPRDAALRLVPAQPRHG